MKIDFEKDRKLADRTENQKVVNSDCGCWRIIYER